MKKTFSILTVFVAMLVGCSSDDDSNSGGTVDLSQLVGAWNYSDTETTSITTTEVNGQSFSVTTTQEFVSSTGVIQFNADSTYSVTGDLTVNLSVDGAMPQQQTLDLTQSGTYSLNGNTLILNSNNSSVEQEIVNLTPNNLRLEADFTTNLVPGTSTTTTGFVELTK